MNKFYIENLLPPDSSLINSYNQAVSAGIEHLKNKKILFLTLTRNSANFLENNINSLVNQISPYIEDYKIILFENDSSDDTQSILKILKSQNSKIDYISNTFGHLPYGQIKAQDRVNNLSKYRNLLRESAKIYDQYDYTIVFDSDFLNFSNKGLLNSFGWMSINQSIGAMAGNSFVYVDIGNPVLKLWNYDCWAYRDHWWTDLANLDDIPSAKAHKRNSWFGLYIPIVGLKPYSVYSAFGGMCIYKNQFYFHPNVSYSSEDCEHVMLHHKLSQYCSNFQLYINPSQIMLLDIKSNE